MKNFQAKAFGFTLAEVLITLGIIGIVAAMTLPTLVGNYKKRVVTSKLQKFYSLMQQAILLAEKNYGEMQYWLPEDNTAEGGLKWFNTYLAPNMKILSRTKLDNKYYQVGLSDGSGFVAYNTGGIYNKVHIFYCIELKYCDIERYDGTTSFLFTILTDGKHAKFVAGIVDSQNLTRDELLERCKYGDWDNPGETSTDSKRHTCAQLIQYDGWEIKDDYPWRPSIIEKK